MEISRNNHYIPQMYLSRWGNNKKIQVYRLLVSDEKVPMWSEQSIEHTGSMMNLYVNIRRDNEYDDIEHELNARFEFPAKASLDKVCCECKMTKEDWERISKYVLSQYFRTPACFIWVKDLGNDFLPKQIDELAEDLACLTDVPKERHEIPEEAIYMPISVKPTGVYPDKEHQYVEISAVSGKGLWLMVLKSVLNENSASVEKFRDMKWSIISAASGETWPCCDDPVVVCDYIGDHFIRRPRNVGLAQKTCAIIFPVSPEKALIGTNTRMFDWRFQADLEMTQNIRQVIVNNAFMYVYDSDKSGTIPAIRHRTVNIQEYNRLKEAFGEWFDKYKEIEGPLLNR